MKILYVQFANTMYKAQENNSCAAYWDCFYDTYEDTGYYRCRELSFEIPKWIAEVSYIKPKGTEEEILWVLDDICEVTDRITTGAYDYVLMSLMDCNKMWIRDIIKECPYQEFIIGGYNDEALDILDRYENVHICRSVKDESELWKTKYKYGTDYSIFKGVRTIPRLTLSWGCLNRCKFCIVPHGKVSPVEREVIFQQARSFKGLDFKLVYIDDKTFGQCSNWKIIKEIASEIRKYNPSFAGFIVQTTAKEYIKNVKEFLEYGVIIAEIGLETYNDDILREYRKPIRTSDMNEVVRLSDIYGVKIITNIIVGFPEETEDTYANTIKFINDNKCINFIGINPAIYTDYSRPDNTGEVDFAPGTGDLHRYALSDICDAGIRLIIDNQYINR